jgi:hypothetical protein
MVASYDIKFLSGINGIKDVAGRALVGLSKIIYYFRVC